MARVLELRPTNIASHGCIAVAALHARLDWLIDRLSASRSSLVAALATDFKYLIAQPLKRGIRRSRDAGKIIDGKAAHRDRRLEYRKIELLGKMVSDSLCGERNEIAVRHNQRCGKEVRDHRDDPSFESELRQMLICPTGIFSSR